MSTTVTLPIREYYQLLEHQRLDEKITGAKIVHTMIGETGKLEFVSCLEENEAIRKITEEIEKERLKRSYTNPNDLSPNQKQLIKDINIKINDMKMLNIYLTIIICTLLSIIAFLCFKLV